MISFSLSSSWSIFSYSLFPSLSILLFFYPSWSVILSFFLLVLLISFSLLIYPIPFISRGLFSISLIDYSRLIPPSTPPQPRLPRPTCHLSPALVTSSFPAHKSRSRRWKPRATSTSGKARVPPVCSERRPCDAWVAHHQNISASVMWRHTQRTRPGCCPESLLILTIFSQTSGPDLDTNWARFIPNGTNSGVLLCEPKCTKSDLEKSQICPIPSQSGPLCGQAWHPGPRRGIRQTFDLLCCYI